MAEFRHYHEAYLVDKDIHRSNTLYSFCRFAGCDIHLEVPKCEYYHCEFDESCCWFYHGKPVDPMFEKEE